MTARTTPAVPVPLPSAGILVLGSLAGLLGFAWPLLLAPGGEGPMPSLIFIGLLPLLVLVMLAELSAGRLDARALAMLGVLTAIGAIVRPLGAGTAGVETVFVLLVLGGRVFGPGFGFVLGSTTLFASALLTGWIGPWLPFQMLAASWVGLGAGLLPPARGRAEIALLAAYGIIAALAFGLLMNLWFWPFALGLDTDLSFVPGAPLLDNLHRLIVFALTTSLGWDIGRAVTLLVLLVLLGPAILAALRRAARRAAFASPPPTLE